MASVLRSYGDARWDGPFEAVFHILFWPVTLLNVNLLYLDCCLL
jgi:hypothetical protein